MSTIEMLYLWIATACLLAFIAGFSSGVWATLHILWRWQRQWQADRENTENEPVEPTANITPFMPPILPDDGESFERPHA